MAFDYKKEYKEYYLPAAAPSVVDVPEMRYVAVRGVGDPNAPDGNYKRAVEVLYAVAYTIKMSKKGDRRIDGYFDFVVPPLEGFWQVPDGGDFDYADKTALRWIACIRLPDFVGRADFDWAVETAANKKKLDCSKAEYLAVREGLCVQILHTGSYDDEPASVARMRGSIAEQGYVEDMSDTRLHHEIYLSDPRKTATEKLRTVIRHPVRRI
ncbi:MAG: GyrI-like domain-containing protein [Clostridia bacterium]|nr:GyrI-like domain-containing protein [Clostridia bacterium]